MTTRPPAVAGLFYPESPAPLKALLADCFAAARATADSAARPRALIVPHAGYVYSGATAAAAFRLLEPLANRIRRVILLGPAHRVAFPGMAVPEADRFATPFGPIAIDAAARATALELPGVLGSDLPHAQEHALEVQLPFLQTVLEDFSLLPVVVGEARPAEVAMLIAAFCDDPQTLIIVSTDLSHFHRYADAQRLDGATISRVLALDDTLEGEDACGARPLNGLLHLARERGWQPRLLASCNSGDTAGDRQRVVGYAAFALYDGDSRH